MAPKEKAKELFDKYQIAGSIWYADRTKNYALIAVDEILYALSIPPIQNKGHLLYDGQIDYWLKVKEEIEKL